MRKKKERQSVQAMDTQNLRQATPFEEELEPEIDVEASNMANIQRRSDAFAINKKIRMRIVPKKKKKKRLTLIEIPHPPATKAGDAEYVKIVSTLVRGLENTILVVSGEKMLTHIL